MYNQRWQDFLDTIKESPYSFELKQEKENLEALWYDPVRRLLLYATCWDGRLNSCTLYGATEITDWKPYPRILEGCSHGPTDGTDRRRFSFDGRTGLLDKLQHLNEVGSCEWPEKGFLWLVNHEEENMCDYNYEAITDSKLGDWFPF